MLHTFLTSNRDLIINRCKAKVDMRSAPARPAGMVDHGVPLFLQQLIKTLQSEQRTDVRDAADAEPTPAATDIGRAAALHGAELLRRGFSIDQVVHDYGDVCQCITALAVEKSLSISSDEFRTLNRCLDDAIADAVTSFGSAHQRSIELEAQSLQQRLRDFAIEHRRLVDIAVESLAAIRTGNIGISGATGTLLAQALEEMGSLTDRTLAHELGRVRSAAKIPGEKLAAIATERRRTES
jgi:hypothetical protein